MKRRGYDRMHRVADLLQKELAKLILEYGDDERFRLVTVVSVTVSRDLSFAKVYVTVLLDDTDEIRDVMKALDQSAKALRYQLAHAVKLRVIPELRFYYDASTAHGFHISSLIESALKKSEKS